MYYCCFWGWEKRQTKSTNKQTNKVNKIYLGWTLTKFLNKYGEQNMVQMALI